MAHRSGGAVLDSEVPQAFTQTAGPNPKVRAKRDRSRRIVGIVIALIVATSLVNLVMMVGNYRNAQDLKAAVAQDSSPSFKSRYDILGAQVVESWMTGDQPVVDTIEGIAWPVQIEGETTGIDVVSVGYLGGRTEVLAGSSDYHESLSYSVVATDGSQYTAAIDMGIVNNEDGSVRPVLLSAPLIEPRASVGVVAGAGMPAWPVFKVNKDAPLERQAAQWATAWTTNDGEVLKSLTGDSSEGAYTGIDSAETWAVTDGSLSLLWAVSRPEDDLVVARVMWDITTALPEGVVDPKASTGAANEVVVQPKTIRQSADLLISDAGTGLPKVVAWGAPGTYESLQPFQNATTEGGE